MDQYDPPDPWDGDSDLSHIVKGGLKAFLLPQESIRFVGKKTLRYADKKYQVVITDKRFILYAQRGHFLKSDDIVSERLDRLNGLEYSEKGVMFREARISIQGTTKMNVHGPISELKPLFHTMESIIKNV